MAKARKRSRIHFQPPFLIGALSVLSLGAGGCSGLTSDGPETTTDGTGNPGDVCPLEGSPCWEAGQTCGTRGGFCGSSPEVICGSDGVWYRNQMTCNPPATYFYCPAELPQSGDSCADHQPGLVCAVATCEQPGIRCGTDGFWLFEHMSCNPPGMGGAPGSEGLGGEGQGATGEFAP